MSLLIIFLCFLLIAESSYNLLHMHHKFKKNPTFSCCTVAHILQYVRKMAASK